MVSFEIGAEEERDVFYGYAESVKATPDQRQTAFLVAKAAAGSRLATEYWTVARLALQTLVTA